MEIDLYTQVAYRLSRALTLRYSSSFGLASRLFARPIRPHIYAIYGMVRVADEIVDTYGGPDKAEQLDTFYREVAASLTSGYSPNPIVHAFAGTARRYGITLDLIRPFFDSMRTDLTQTTFTQKQYETYIYGSAEVIGLMCLKVFCPTPEEYDARVPGAKLLGSAYQKVNFLRDFGADYRERGRIYFPGVSFDSWDDARKNDILGVISHEFDGARTDIKRLPRSARISVYLSYLYYRRLLKKLSRMSADEIVGARAHVSTLTKLILLFAAPIGVRVR